MRLLIETWKYCASLVQNPNSFETLGSRDDSITDANDQKFYNHFKHNVPQQIHDFFSDASFKQSCTAVAQDISESRRKERRKSIGLTFTSLATLKYRERKVFDVSSNDGSNLLDAESYDSSHGFTHPDRPRSALSSISRRPRSSLSSRNRKHLRECKNVFDRLYGLSKKE